MFDRTLNSEMCHHVPPKFSMYVVYQQSSLQPKIYILQLVSVRSLPFGLIIIVTQITVFLFFFPFDAGTRNPLNYSPVSVGKSEQTTSVCKQDEVRRFLYMVVNRNLEKCLK